jgi:hypothetical protein
MEEEFKIPGLEKILLTPIGVFAALLRGVNKVLHMRVILLILKGGSCPV